MLKKAYVEITNVCNLSCPFCHGSSRAPAFMTPEDFRVIAGKLRPYTEYIYLHLLGEPLLHPELREILSVCDDLGFKVTVVTNGTLIGKAGDVLLESGCLYKVCFSLHSFEVNEVPVSLEEYLEGVCRFAQASSKNGVINVFKLWNAGAKNSLNGEILDYINSRFETGDGSVYRKRIHIDLADAFRWPDMDADFSEPRFCMGLRDQIGVLCDGTAVPCCLDAEGEIKLGNLLTDSVEDALNCERAKKLVKGFSEGRPVEELCRRCDFAKRRFG